MICKINIELSLVSTKQVKYGSLFTSKIVSNGDNRISMKCRENKCYLKMKKQTYVRNESKHLTNVILYFIYHFEGTKQRLNLDFRVNTKHFRAINVGNAYQSYTTNIMLYKFIQIYLCISCGSPILQGNWRGSWTIGTLLHNVVQK